MLCYATATKAVIKDGEEVEGVSAKMAEYDLGQHYPVEIRAPNKCPALRYSNRSMSFGTNYKMLLLLTAEKVAKES